MLVIFALLLLIGMISLYWQIKKKMAFTDISDEVPWGIYIVAYFYLAGAGGGLVFLSAVGDLIIPGIAGISAQLALGFFVGAGFSLLLDLGRPERALKILKMKTKSPMFWDFIGLIVGFGGAAILFLWQPQAEFSLLRMIIGILSCIIVFAAEGWTLNLCPGRGIWNERLITVVLALEGLSLAMAILIIFRHGPRIMQYSLLGTLLAVLVLNFWQISGELFLPQKSKGWNNVQKVRWVLLFRITAFVLVLVSSTKALVVMGAVLILIAGFMEKFEQVLLPQLFMAYGQWNKYKHIPKYNIEVNKGLIVAGLFGIVGLTFEILNLLLPFISG